MRTGSDVDSRSATKPTDAAIEGARRAVSREAKVVG